MTDQRFDLSFEGILLPGTNPDEARRQLAAMFRLSEQEAERLFGDKAVTVKRGVDSATADRFERAFAEAGAVLTIIPLGGAFDDSLSAPAAGAGRDPLAAIDISWLSLAPMPQVGNLEETILVNVALPRTDHLNLVPGDDWTLADCAPPPVPVPLPDLSWLSLEPLPASSEEEDEGGR